LCYALSISRLQVVSAVQALTDELRELIFDGELASGERLREVDWAARYEVGRQTFRAAAQQLIHEGLLVSAPNRGIFVPELTLEDIDDVFEFRTVLELEAVERVIGASGDLEAAERAVRDLAELEEDAPWRAVVDADQRFHRALVDATGSPRLIRAYEALQSEVILCIVMTRMQYPHHAAAATEHRELLELIHSGDLPAARAGLRAHLEDAAANVRVHYSTHPQSRLSSGSAG
jgi:DNA-binding GntR family transcriptional regulator